MNDSVEKQIHEIGKFAQEYPYGRLMDLLIEHDKIMARIKKNILNAPKADQVDKNLFTQRQLTRWKEDINLAVKGN